MVKGIFSVSIVLSLFFCKQNKMSTNNNIIEEEKDLKHDIIIREHEEETYQVDDYGDIRPEPTEEDWKNLREVADDIPKAAYLVILVEFCERFTYYGLTGPFQNYIQNPNPPSCKFLPFFLTFIFPRSFKLIPLLTT